MTEPLYTALEMRDAEAGFAGTTLQLMERAGATVAEAVVRRFPDARKISVWCGPGANGGDGLVVARLLHNAGRNVEIRLLGAPERARGDAAENLRRANELGLRFVDEAGPADLVVDALFGTGFTGAPRKQAAEAIAMINASDDAVVAVDVPSGVDASTGEVAGAAVRATATVTFHGRKLGLAVAPGCFHAGEVEIADIGLEHERTRNRGVTADILDAVPRRRAEDNKYSAGTVVVVGGSVGFTGAPSITAQAAMRAGAGIVFACVPASLSLVFEHRLLEVVTRPCADADGHLHPEAADRVLEVSRRAGAVAIGPGLGRTEGAGELVRTLLERLEVPVVLDADALYPLAGNLDWVFVREAPTVLTPHAGELGRLLGQRSSAVNARRLHSVRAGADDSGAVVLLKGADTLVAAPGRGVHVSSFGNPGLASAGTGDALTGVVAAFLAKGVEPHIAAAAAACAHGLAADLAARHHGFAGLLASDVVEALSSVLSDRAIVSDEAEQEAP